MVVRWAVDDDEDQFALAAAGMTRIQRWSVRMICRDGPGRAGRRRGVVVAAALSGAFPIGPAATAEPSPGFSLNVAWVVLGGVAAVVRSSPLPPDRRGGRRASASAGARDRRVPYRVVDVVARGGAQPGRRGRGGHGASAPAPGRRSLQRLSLAGSIVAVGLLVGAVVFGASLHHLLDVPVSYGWRWDAVASLDASDDEPVGRDAAVPRDRARPARDRSRPQSSRTRRWSCGATSVAAIGWRPVRGDLAPTLLSGRLPTGPDEIALGGRTATSTGLSVGSVTTVSGRTGAADRCTSSVRSSSPRWRSTPAPTTPTSAVAC